MFVLLIDEKIDFDAQVNTIPFQIKWLFYKAIFSSHAMKRI